MKYFDYEYRVRYGDTDKMGISYYANYFVWFEAARTEYFRALGIPYSACEEKGIYLPVTESHAKYIAPSTYDEEVIVRTSVSEISKSSLRFEYQVLQKNSKKLLVSGYTVHVFVDKEMKPCRVPSDIGGKVELYSLPKK